MSFIIRYVGRQAATGFGVICPRCRFYVQVDWIGKHMPTFRSNAFDVVAEEVATSLPYGESATGLFQTREISELVTSG